MAKRNLMWGLLVLALLLAPVAQAARVALVIGNDAYTQLPHLEKAVNDANSFAQALRDQGFEQVTLKTNVDGTALNAAIAHFVESVQPGDTAFFMFSGHGWSDGAQNYILPVDAPKTGSESFLKRVSVPVKNGVNGVLDDLHARDARLKVAVIDACRDNPFAPSGGRSVGLGRGLVRVTPPEGTFVIMSAGDGQVALDRLGNSDRNPNSVFTRVFLPLLQAGGTLQDAIKSAQIEVLDLARSIRHEQRPAYYDEVTGPACLRTDCGAIEPATAAVAPLYDPRAAEEVAFRAAQTANSVAGWEIFKRSYPGSAYLAAAEIQLASLTRPPPPPATQATRPSAPAAGGSDARDCPDCPEMVKIPGRNYSMGKYEVTFDEWDACVTAGGCSTRPDDRGWGRGRRPVINVSWEDAQQYVKWLSDKTGKRYRLPTGEEWEHATRAGTTTRYWWGDSISCSQARYGRREDGECSNSMDGTAPVGSYAANPWGLHDVHGNVSEWTDSCLRGDCSSRNPRGGSWYLEPAQLRAADRSRWGIADIRSARGFRVARTD